MKARTVAQVIAAEAGGKTRAQRLSAMKDVFSAIYNRAMATGASIEDVVAGSKQFTAYNHRMPAGTENLVDLAEQAMQEVQQNGPTHKGTFYARSYATGGLPKGLSRIKTAVDDHVYFSDPKNRAIVTAAGVLRPQAATNVASAEPAGGLLASFFGPQAAAADEMPGGLAPAEISGADIARSKANAPTDGTPYSGPGATFTPGGLAAPGLGRTVTGGLGGGMMGSVGINADPAASNEDEIQRMERATGMYQPGIATNEQDVQRMEREAGMFQPPDPARFAGTPAAAPGPSVGGIMAPDASAGYKGGQIGALSGGQNGGIMSSALAGLGGLFGPAEGVATGYQRSPDGSTADPFGNYKQGGPLATVPGKMQEAAPGSTVAYTPPGEVPGVHIGGLQPIGAREATVPVGPEASLPGISPQVQASIDPGLIGQPQGALAPPGVGAMPDMGKANTFAPQVGGLMQGLSQPTVAAPDYAPSSLNTYPDAPREPTRVDQAIAAARMGINQMRNAFREGIDSGPPARGGTNYGSGLAAMQAAMSGAPGGMAQSRSNPGYGFQKTDTGGIRTGPYGWQALDASGETSGGLHSYDGGTGGLFGGLSDAIGGLFGGEGRGGRRSKDKDRDGKERGGLY